MANQSNKVKRNGLLAITPMLFLVVMFVLFGFLMGAFSKIPLLIVFFLTSIYAMWTLRGMTVQERLSVFSKGAGNETLLLMVWIFLLAGGFVETAKLTGAVDSMVNLTLSFLPSNLLLPGIFFASCFVSISIGSAFGTVVALAPIGVGLCQSTGIPIGLLAGAVVGGSFFGDNLSFISDTTIVATRLQGCPMRDKFRANIRFALPAALITAAIYYFLGGDQTQQPEVGSYNLLLVLPYLVVLILAIVGIDVMLVLVIGIACTCMTGLITGNCSLVSWIVALAEGMKSMGEITFIAMMAGGILNVISRGGGLVWIMRGITKRVNGVRGAELSIVTLVAITCACTAYNTIAILSVGHLSKNIADRYGITPRRTASLLDTGACCVQGLLPYGAHLLVASTISGISSLELVRYEFYPLILLACLLTTILLSKRKTNGKEG